MEYEEGIDALGIAEEHAERVLELEEEQAEKLLRVYQRVAARIRSRLANYPKDTFTAQHMRSTLLQIEAAMRAFETELSEEARLGAQLMADRGIRDLVRETNEHNDYFNGTLNPINLDAMLAALDTDKRLINNYDVSIQTYSAALRNRIAGNIAAMQAERVTNEEMYTRLFEQDAVGRFFEGEGWRLRRIVRTELHGVYGQGKLAALGRIADDNKGMRKALYHPKDHRTADDSLYLESINPRPKVEDPFVYVWQNRDKDGKPTGKRYRRVFMSPPDRPNDRAILVPFHPSWE